MKSRERALPEILDAAASVNGMLVREKPGLRASMKVRKWLDRMQRESGVEVLPFFTEEQCDSPRR